MFNDAKELFVLIDVFQSVMLRNLYVISNTEDAVSPKLVMSQERFGFLTEIKFTTRLFLLDEKDIENLWLNKIRHSNEITDYVSSVLTEIDFYCAVADGKLYKLLEDACTKYLSAYKTDVSGVKFDGLKFDEDFFEQALEEKDANNIMKLYPWLKVLILIKLSNFSFFFEKQVKELALYRKATKPKASKNNATPATETPATDADNKS